ncbi:MAG: hypothetical protein RMI43_04435 [Candidatus Caldarchaeum sp.]|nr:hypothetical protein [Candidatus Caldarchaeum sp.]MCS7133382.1 hypothetical protein [Candidatus Caldarchaeum sp.]MDW8063398.1 hypothetical protein [Candidatus Caldarchaeum sp.]MDW8435719.1 hypothetical protein [Candidatus Caldarchaeum sp.]
MSGFGILVSLAFSSLIILQIFGYVMTVFENVATVAEISRIKNDVLVGFDASVESVSGNVVTAKVHNRGPRDIPCRNLKNADLFVVYFDENGNRKIKHLGILARGESAGWTVADVKFGDSFDEILDPVVLSPTPEGVWNVGETLWLTVYPGEPVNSSLPVIVKLWVVA